MPKRAAPKKSDRAFCRFQPPGPGNPTGLDAIPPAGFCLNAFLIVRPPDDDRRVLLGRMDPKAPWDRLGGLDAERVARWSEGWMLPASQLLYGEDPGRAVDRLREELLDSAPMQIGLPRVLSEAYPSKRDPTAGDHWDLSFVYLARATSSKPPPLGPWRELQFVDVTAASPTEFARAHDDVLRFAGITVGGA